MKHKNDVEFNAKLYGKQKFSLRKLSIGLVAVTLGTTFYLTNGQLVHADTGTDSDANGAAKTEVVENQSQDAGKSNSDSASTAASNNEETGKQTDANSADTNATETTVKNNASDKTDSDASSDSNSSSDTQTVNVADLTKSGSADVSTLKENKSEDTTSTSVTVKSTDSSGNETDTVDPSTAKSMEAGQDTVNLHIDLDNLTKDDTKFTFNLSNVGDNSDFIVNSSNLGEKGNNISIGSNWTLTNNGDGNFTATWNSTTQDPTSLSINIPLQGNQSTVKSAKDSSVAVTVTKSDGSSTTYDGFKANITPYVDKVVSDQIIKGFPTKTTTVGTEKGYGNISDADIAETGATDDQTVLQYGVYFNYGKGGAANPDLDPLMDAIAKLQLGGDQTLLPSSIKVFQVPDNMIVDSDGNRLGENDVDPATGKTYYDEICTNDNYSSDFSQYLKDNTDGNTIAIDQTVNGQHVTFYVPKSDGTKDTSYSKHAYYIQIDALLTKNKTIPGSGETITTQSFDGTGSTIDNNHSSWKGMVSGDGQGQDKENKEQAQILYYDDTTGQYITPSDSSDKYQVSVTGDPDATIDFGTDATNDYKDITSRNYVYAGVTSGTDATSQDFIKDDSGKTAAFASTGIYSTFDETDNTADPTKDTNPQVFIVHFNHGTKTTTETATVTENVTYQYENGPHAGKNIQDPTTKTVTYNKTDTTDLVTNQTTEGTWTPDVTTGFGDITYPAGFAGKDRGATADDIYKIDKSGIDSTNSNSSVITNANKDNASFTVATDKFTNGGKYTYSVTVPYKLTENIAVHYIDEDNNNKEIHYENLHNSYSGDPKSTTANETSSDISFLSGKGYELDKDATTKGFNDTALGNTYTSSALTFDNDENLNNQVYYVYFHHAKENTTETATVIENVTYQYENGPHARDNIQDPTTKTVTYTRTKTTDKQNGNVTYTDWTPSDASGFTAIAYPDGFAGQDADATKGNIYKIDKSGIKATNSDDSVITSANDENASFVVSTDKLANYQTYTYSVTVPYKLTENIMVHFIDEDDNNGTEIATSRYTGDPKATTANNSQATLDALESEGYLLDSGATNGVAGSATNPNLTYDYTKLNFNGDNKLSDANLTFDNDENLDNQNYYIYLHHNVVSDVEEKTITENIKYIDEATGQEIHDAYASGKLTFNRTVYTDKTNGKVTYSNWSVASFKPVANPEISGYTIDADKITEKLNGADSKIADHNAKEIGEANFHKLSDGEITALPDGSTLNFVVPYTENPEPTPEPSQPTQPTAPTQPTIPSPVHPQNPPTDDHHDNHKNHNHGSDITTVIPKGQDVDHSNGSSHKTSTVGVKSTTSPVELSHKVSSAKANKASENKRELPQTSEGQSKLGLIGLAFASLAGLIALAGDRKKKNN